MSENESPTPEKPEAGTPSLSEILREAMERQHMSNNRLAKAAGVSEGTIRNLLKEDADADATGPQAGVLKAICDVLGLNDIRVFQAAGYLSPSEGVPELSVTADYLARRFEQLPSDKQEILWSTLESLEKLSGLASPAEAIGDVLQAAQELRKKHPIFANRRLVLGDYMGRVLGSALFKLSRQTVPEVALDAAVTRLRALYRNDTSQPISRAHVAAVIHHPKAGIVLNALLPHKTVTSPGEKLYWLLHPDTKPFEYLDRATLNAFEDLWALLVQVSQSPSHNERD